MIVASGGITRLWRNEFPAAMDVHLALVLELDQVEMEGLHELQVVVMNQDGEKLAEIRGAFQAASGDAEVGEKVQIPFTFDLKPVGLPALGAYDVKVYVDGHHQQDLTVWCKRLPTTTTEIS